MLRPARARRAASRAAESEASPTRHGGSPMPALPNIIRRSTNGSSAKRDLLRQIPLLADRPRRELDFISSFTEVVDVPAGQMLTRECCSGREFFVLASGAAEVRRDGRHLATVEPGGFFGEIALVTKLPRTATVTAPVSSRVLVMTDRDFRRLVEIDPQIRLRILSPLTRRLEGLTVVPRTA